MFFMNKLILHMERDNMSEIDCEGDRGYEYMIHCIAQTERSGRYCFHVLIM